MHNSRRNVARAEDAGSGQSESGAVLQRRDLHDHRGRAIRELVRAEGESGEPGLIGRAVDDREGCLAGIVDEGRGAMEAQPGTGRACDVTAALTVPDSSRAAV